MLLSLSFLQPANATNKTSGIRWDDERFLQEAVKAEQKDRLNEEKQGDGATQWLTAAETRTLPTRTTPPT